MPNARINVPLALTERSALMRLAEYERREPRDQAAYIIRRELERAGLLEPLTVQSKNAPDSPAWRRDESDAKTTVHTRAETREMEAIG